MTHDELREKVARACYRAWVESIDDLPAEEVERQVERFWQEWFPEADAALAAVREALREPSEDAARAAHEAYWRKYNDAMSIVPTEHPKDGGGPIGYAIRAWLAASPLSAPRA